MKRYPIILLHGWNLNAAKLAPLQQELEKRGYTVHCIDLPGFRHTGPLTHPFTIPDYGDYVRLYLQKRNVKQAIFIGHSFGGRIAIYLSVSAPSMVKALVVSGTPALGADLTAKENMYFLLAKTGKRLFSPWPLSILAAGMRKILYRIVGSYDYYRASGLLRETFQLVVGYRLEPLLSKISVPTLLIWGEDDRIVPIRVAYGMKERIPNARLLILPDARHAAPWTHASAFASEVESFIESLCRS